MNTHANSHDGLFKVTFSDPEIVRDYLLNFLPKEFSAQLHLDTLRLLPNSFISPKLEAFYSDLIYQCRFGAEELLISLLFEHKSSPQKYPHLQLLRYMVSLWEAQIKQKKPLLPVIPIIVYHGKQKWHKRPFEEYFGINIDPILKPYLPLFDYQLTDLSEWSDEALQDMEMGLLYNTFLLMKHYGEIDYVRRSIHKLFKKIEYYLSTETGQNQFQAFLVYLISTTKIEELELHQLFKSFPMETKEHALTVYEQLILKGEIKGKLEAANEFIKGAYHEGVPLETIAKISKISLEELKSRLKQMGLNRANTNDK